MNQALVSTVYNVALLLLLLAGSPWWLFLLLTRSKFREGLVERFFGPSLHFTPADKPRIWVHAVSVGEVLAISGLLQELTRRLPNYQLVLSTTTRTGQRLARQRFGPASASPAACIYFPLDFPWSVGSALRRIAPAIVVLAESELWPNVLRLCSRKRIPVMLVNARVSDRSLPRYVRLRSLWRPFLQLLSLVHAQTHEDAGRLRRIGIPPGRVLVGGNLKFDVRPPLDVPITARMKERLAPGARLFICGSTLEGEESLLLAAWPAITDRVPQAVLLLAPRHPERFEAVASLLQDSGLSWVRRSQWMESPKPIVPGSVFLLDSIGELASLYSLACVAFIGGSLVPAGGHNPLEPAQFGVAITMGPHADNFRAITRLLIATRGLVVLNATDLSSTIAVLLLDDEQRIELGRNAQRVCAEQSGATMRAADMVVSFLPEGASPRSRA